MDATTDGGRECDECGQVKHGLFHVEEDQIVCTGCYSQSTGPRHPF